MVTQMVLRKDSLTRFAILTLFPLFVGGSILLLFVPLTPMDSGSRLQPSFPPSDYVVPRNSINSPTEDQVRGFALEQNLEHTSLEEAKSLLISKYAQEGFLLYQKNCSHCHGIFGDGDGTFADSFRLKATKLVIGGSPSSPALRDRYLFWRISEGSQGLPPEARPWDSTMPAWKDSLTTEEIFKIILALQKGLRHVH